MREMKYREVEEKTVFFDLPDTDGLRIKGILRGELTNPVVVMMHGRPGSGNELLQYLGSRYLTERGVTTLRLFMYDFAPKTRNLLDCTLQTHADDFAAVVYKLRRQGVQRIFGIGHSYGGLTILKSGVELDAAVLWDPTHGSWWAEDRGALPQNADEYPEITLDDYVIGTAGPGWIYPAAAEKYDKKLGDTSEWAIKDYPLMIISAGKGMLADLGARYIKAAHGMNSHTTIADAHHNFEDSDTVMLDLFERTYGWLDKARGAATSSNKTRWASMTPKWKTLR